DGARTHLDRALELSGEGDVNFGRSQILLSHCELAMREGKIEQADELARQALELAEGLEEGASIAEAHLWVGRIADRRGGHQAVDRAFEDAISGFEALGLRERLLHCHGAYAEILERRGEVAKAYAHMKEALQASRPGLLRREEQQERVTSASGRATSDNVDFAARAANYGRVGEVCLCWRKPFGTSSSPWP